jgi:uncharacterized membrane protein YgaE (UPF0421/DUF939 family)
MVPALQLSLRAAVAATLALALAQVLKLQHPGYAMISAVIVTDLQPAETRNLAPPRLVGTLIGGVFGAAINSVLPPSLWTIASGIMISMFVGDLMSLPATAKVAGYVCGIILLDHGHAPWSYAFFRMVETALGIGTAICVSIVPKLMRTNDREKVSGP